MLELGARVAIVASAYSVDSITLMRNDVVQRQAKKAFLIDL